MVSRNSSIELLRILAMCGVVLLHYNNVNAGGGLLYAQGVNRIVLMFLESVCICAVDLYILISGYYLCTTSTRRAIKPLELLVQVSLFSAATQGLSALLSGTLSLGVVLLNLAPNNYFVVLYAVVYLISPYINQMLDKLNNRLLCRLTLLLLVIFSLWTTLVDQAQLILGVNWNAMSAVGINGSQMGYTVVNFLLMYVLGAFIRRSEAKLLDIANWKYLLLFVAGSIALTAWAFLYQDVAWSYCNPVVIVMACTLFLLFLKWQFSSRLINELAKSAFTCFLLHGIILTRIGIDIAVKSSFPVMLGHIVISIVAIYGICYVAHLIWSWVTTPVFRWISKKLERADRWLSLEG